MAEIISKEPWKKDNRSQQLINFDDDTQKVRCFNPLTSPYYFDKGTLAEIDNTHTELTGLFIDDCQLRNKNIMSVGIRKSGDPDKFIGFRPDTTQHAGEEQIEFSLKKIIIDGYQRVDDLSKLDTVDNKTTDLGDIVIQSTQSRTRQLIKIPEATKNMEAHYEIDLKNVKFKNEFKQLENELFLKGQRVNFVNFGKVDPAGWKKFDDWAISKKSEKGYDVSICKVGFDLITSPHDDWEKIHKIETNIHQDMIPSHFTTYKSEHKTGLAWSVYRRNSINIKIKNIPETHYVSNTGGRGSVTWFIESLVNEVFKPIANEVTKGKQKLEAHRINLPETETYHPDSVYLLFLDGKVIGNLMLDTEHTLNCFFRTADVSEYDYIFKETHMVGTTEWETGKGSFNFLNCNYDKFVEKFQTFIETFSYPEVRITGNYAVPEGYNTFKILNIENKCILKLAEPGLFDENLNRMDHRTYLEPGDDPTRLHEKQNTLQITHTLRKISNTKYEYIKYARETNPLSTIMQSARYLDAETVYGDTDDYTVSHEASRATAWNTIFEAAEGTESSFPGLTSSLYAGSVRDYTISNKMSTHYRRCSRTCFYFDTSDNYWASDITVSIYGAGTYDGDPAHLSPVQGEFEGTLADYSRYAGGYANSLGEVTDWSILYLSAPNVFSIPDGSLAPFGITCFLFRSDWDIEKTSVGENNSKACGCWFSESSYKPYVEFTPQAHQPITIVT